MIDQVKDYLLDLQNTICEAVEVIDGAGRFHADEWQKDNGKGYGITNILSGGEVFERAGVNFSYVEVKFFVIKVVGFENTSSSKFPIAKIVFQCKKKLFSTKYFLQSNNIIHIKF